jgi:hypothetical protein
MIHTDAGRLLGYYHYSSKFGTIAELARGVGDTLHIRIKHTLIKRVTMTGREPRCDVGMPVSGLARPTVRFIRWPAVEPSVEATACRATTAGDKHGQPFSWRDADPQHKLNRLAMKLLKSRSRSSDHAERARA